MSKTMAPKTIYLDQYNLCLLLVARDTDTKTGGGGGGVDWATLVRMAFTLWI